MRQRRSAAGTLAALLVRVLVAKAHGKLIEIQAVSGLPCFNISPTNHRRRRQNVMLLERALPACHIIAS
jgi:hypothetical protein